MGNDLQRENNSGGDFGGGDGDGDGEGELLAPSLYGIMFMAVDGV
jgi:hypothetical protein